MARSLLFPSGSGGICTSSGATRAVNDRFLDSAEEEMLAAAQIYDEQAAGLGERFLDEVEGCVDLLLDRPYIGTRVAEFRRFRLRKFPFTLV